MKINELVSESRMNVLMRIGLIAIALIIFGIGTSLRAEDRPLGEIAEAAASACAKGEWTQAVELYSKLLERDVADPAIYYNLGTAYARSGDIGRGVWMLLRARRLAPRDGMIRDNLTQLAPDVESQTAAFPIFPLELLGNMLSLGEWAIFAAILTIAGGLAWSSYFFARESSVIRPTLRKVAFVTAIIAVAAHGVAGVKYYQERLVSRGVITGENVYPRETPDEAGQASEFTLKPGTVIRVESSGVEGWVKAIYGGKTEVFIQRSQMEFL